MPRSASLASEAIPWPDRCVFPGPGLAVLLLVLGGVDGGASATAPGCPADAEIRRALALEGAEWQVACKMGQSGEAQMAGFFAAPKPGAPLHLVVAVVRGEHRARVELELAGPEEDAIRKIPAEEWMLSVGPAKISGTDWLQVDVTGRGGEDLFFVQGVVTFFQLENDQLKWVWTGLGDRTEVRFDACRLDTVARFSRAPNGSLVRSRRGYRAFADPGGIDAHLLKEVRSDCVRPPSKRDEFPIIEAPKPPTGQ